MYGIIRIRSKINVDKKINKTMELLNIPKINNCVVVPENKYYKGMIKKVKDFVTFGEINEKNLKKLITKNEKKINWDKLKKEKKEMNTSELIKEILKEKIKLKDIGIKNFKLKPPRKGFERKGIKKPFKEGGALGYRGEKINDLLKRMI